jgi:hypothetical protein
MSDDNICAYRVYRGCEFAGLNGSGFFPVGVLQITPVQESLTQMQELMHDIRVNLRIYESRVDAPSF